MVWCPQTHIYTAQHTGPALSRPQQGSGLKALGQWVRRPRPAFVGKRCPDPSQFSPLTVQKVGSRVLECHVRALSLHFLISEKG